MADQSVRTCHPFEFYYFRRSPLIPLLFALSFYLLTPCPSSRPSHPNNSSLPLHPFHLPFSSSVFSLSFSLFFLFARFRPTDRLALSSSTSFHLLVTPLRCPSRASTPARHEKKTRTRELYQRVMSAGEIKQRRNLEHVCSGFAAASSRRLSRSHGEFIGVHTRSRVSTSCLSATVSRLLIIVTRASR